MEIKDKKIIITGGVKGIGKSLLDKLIEEGAMVGVFDIDKKGLDSLKKTYRDVFCKVCDVANYEQVKTSVDEVFKEFKQIDVLVNNAGVLFSLPLVSITPDGIKKHDLDAWNKVISTNLSSTFYVTVNVVEKMISNRTKGVIVNISSVSSSGNAGQSAYSAAKAGVNALTATWAKELSLLGIRVVGIAPGYTETESTRHVMSESALKDVISKVPLRRLGKPDEIADGIIAIIKNDFFNGKVLELDGGLVI